MVIHTPSDEDRDIGRATPVSIERMRGNHWVSYIVPSLRLPGLQASIKAGMDLTNTIALQLAIRRFLLENPEYMEDDINEVTVEEWKKAMIPMFLIRIVFGGKRKGESKGEQV